MNSLARAGVFSLQDASEKPKPLPVQIVDLLCGWSAATQICAALYKRKFTKNGKGEVIDVSMFDMAVSTMIMSLSSSLSSNQKISDGKEMYVQIW